jgi:hypothetical protein
MKRILTIAILGLVVALALTLTGCGQSSNKASDESPFKDAKTMGEAFEIGGDATQSYITEKECSYIFNVDDTYYRVAADLNEGMYADIDAIDFFSEDREDKVREVLSPLEIKQIDNLTKAIPTQEEMDKLIGKTGQELFDDEYAFVAYNLEGENAEFTMEKGLFQYKLTFDGQVAPDMLDSDDYAAMVKDLKVKSIEFEGLSNMACELQYTVD